MVGSDAFDGTNNSTLSCLQHEINNESNQNDNLWKGASESTSSSGMILQLVGLDSPANTVFGRLIVPALSTQFLEDSSSGTKKRNLDGSSVCQFSVQDLLEWLLQEIIHQRPQTSQWHNETELQPQLLSAHELLQLGSVWRLSPRIKKHPSKAKTATSHHQQQQQQQQQLRRSRLSLEHAGEQWQLNDSLRVHVCPSRFPAVYTVHWSIYCNDNNDEIDQIITNTPTNNNAKLPCAILYHNTEFGFVVVRKPCRVPSHATVDNGVENVLDQLVKHNSTDRIISPSLPQRLDIETEGLLLVATKREFSSYMGRLLQEKTNTACDGSLHHQHPPLQLHDTTAIQKQYRCLVHISSVDEYKSLRNRSQALDNNHRNGMVVTHYMDSSSPAPKTFAIEIPAVAADKEKWLKCDLRILHVGPLMQFRAVTTNKYDDDLSSAGELSLVAEITVELLTGRTHQIRGQFTAMKMPLVGDPLYGPEVVTTGSKSVENDISWAKTRHRGSHNCSESNVSASASVSSLGLQCCSLRIRKPKWGQNKHNRSMLLKGNDDVFDFELEKAWWSDQLLVYQYPEG